MNKILHISITVLAALFSITVPAADLPKLPAASSVKTGVLDNGTAYYLVTNATEKGKADIALVRRGGYSDDRGINAGASAVNVMGSLAMLPHFRSDTPFRFLSRNCIWPGAKGYAAVYSDAVVYRFNGLDLSRSKEVVDSTLLLVLDIVGMHNDSDGGRYSPENQAIIVSGDIDAGAVLNKMNMLSMLVTRYPAEKKNNPYSWTESCEASFRLVDTGVRGKASVTAEYKSPRTPEKNMGTVQPLVSRKFAAEFGIIVKKRLAAALRQSDVPVSEIGFEYSGSQSGPGDETYRITVATSVSCLDKAVAVLSGTLADLDKSGVGIDEYRDSENELVMNLKREYSGDVKDNAMYVEQCISAYLYGSSLASASTSMNFFMTKNIQDDLGARLFNNFIFALLDKSRNLTLECRADLSEVGGYDMPGKFASSWSSGAVRTYKVSNSDTTAFRKPSGKLKLKTSMPEPLSGGQIWTFDNGIKVIYKNVPKSGMFHYMWLLKGGYSLLPGLKSGEAAYISDILHLYDVSGMSCWRFSDMLAANGITMNGEVTMSDFRISGAAPSSRLRLLMKALSAMSVDRTLNADAYAYYRKCQELDMLSGSSPEYVLDSLMFSGSVWSPYKKPVRLTDDFAKRVTRFFDTEFSKMNDGVLVLVGDLDEYSLKKDLCRDLDGFDTEKVSSFRSRMQYKSVSGSVSRIENGHVPEVSAGISVPLMFTASNFMASQVAAMALGDKMTDALAECGWYGEPSCEFSMFPEERFSFRIRCFMSDRTGIPASLAQTDSVEFVMARLRRALREASAGLSAKEISIYKSMLLKSMAARTADPETIMSMLVLRYSYGKDIVTKFKDKINALVPDDINNVLSAMSGGRYAEYAVRNAREGEQVHDLKMKTPVFRGLIPPLVPARDSTGLNAEAFRVLGMDSVRTVPGWGDSSVFRRRMKEFPAPVVLTVKRVADTVTAPPADSVAVCPADSSDVEIIVPEDQEELLNL